jgi:hypothetical protein
MWPFRRRTAPPDTAPVHRAGPADWRRLTPVTVVQTSPMTTVDVAFEGRLATRRSPLFVEPLGHELTPDGPSGRTAAELVPGPPRHFGAPPVQRQTASIATPPSDVEADAVPEQPASTGDASPAPPDAIRDVVTAEAVPPPVRPTLAAPVATEPAPTPPSLVRATDDHVAPITFTATPAPPTPHLPVVARAAEHDHDASSAEPGPTVDAAAADDARAQPLQRDAGATGASVVDLVGGPLADASEPATPDDTSPASARTASDARPQPRRDAPAIERAMLDTPARTDRPDDPAPSAPPATAADHAVAVWDALAVDAPAHPTPSPSSAPVVAGGGPSPVTTGTPVMRTTRGLIGPPVPRSEVAGQSAPRRPSPVQRASEASGPAPRTQRDADRSGDPPTVPPTVDARPVPLASGGGRPPERLTTPPVTPVLQRVADDRSTTPAPLPHTPPASVAEPHAASDVNDVIDVVDVVDVRPTLSATWNPGLVEPALQRLGFSPSNAGDGPRTPPVVPPPGLAGTLQRSHDASSPDTAHDGHDVSRADAVVPTLHAPPAPRHPVMSTASTASTATRRVVVGAPVSRSAVQRQSTDVAPRSRTGPIGDGGHPALGIPRHDHDADAMIDVGALPFTEWPPVQRQTDGQPADVPTTVAPVVTADATSGPASTPDQGSAGRSDAEIQELLRTLYPPLRRRLCRDLLLDRERAGYATDIRF